MTMSERESKAEKREARLDWLNSLMPAIITTVFTTGLGLVTLLWQSRQHARDQEAADLAASEAADRNGRDQLATREFQNRLERNKLLREIAPRVVGSAMPSERDCQYAFGIWNDFAQGDRSQLLDNACGAYPATLIAPATSSASAADSHQTAEWVSLVDTDADRKEGCREAAGAKSGGLDTVRLWRAGKVYLTTAGSFSTRTEADAYVQFVRAHAPWSGAKVARVLHPVWEPVDCFSGDGGA
jgi:hypothetical protein